MIEGYGLPSHLSVNLHPPTRAAAWFMRSWIGNDIKIFDEAIGK